MALPKVSPRPFPDIEVLLLNWFTGQQALEQNAVIADVRFCTDLPYILPPGTGEVWARINRVSGATRSYFVDRPIVDLDCYSFDRDLAFAVAQACECLMLWQLRGSTQPEGTVQTVTVVAGPRWIPDENQDISRFGASYELHAKPSPGPASSG